MRVHEKIISEFSELFAGLRGRLAPCEQQKFEQRATQLQLLNDKNRQKFSELIKIVTTGRCSAIEESFLLIEIIIIIKEWETVIAANNALDLSIKRLYDARTYWERRSAEHETFTRRLQKSLF